MEKKIDLRTKKIYISLHEEFKALLEEKPFEDITVNELCERAMTRRATFYKHFSDKYDFFRFTIWQLYEECVKKVEETTTSGNPEEFYYNLIKQGFDLVDSNKKVISLLRSNSVLVLMVHGMIQEFESDLQKHFERDIQAGHFYPVRPEIMTSIFIGGMSQCANWWLAHEDTISKEEMLQELYSVVKLLYGKNSKDDMTRRN